MNNPWVKKKSKENKKLSQNKSGNRISQNLQDAAKMFWTFIAVNVYIKKIRILNNLTLHHNPEKKKKKVQRKPKEENNIWAEINEIESRRQFFKKINKNSWDLKKKNGQNFTYSKIQNQKQKRRHYNWYYTNTKDHNELLRTTKGLVKWKNF